MINKTGTRIYYLISSNEILYHRYDMMSSVQSPTVEEEKLINMVLAEYGAEEIGCIEFEYNEFDDLMEGANANAYRIKNGEIEFYYEEPPEPEPMPDPEPMPETEEQKRIRELEEELKAFKKESEERINKLSDTTLDLLIELSNVDETNPDEPGLDDIF